MYSIYATFVLLNDISIAIILVPKSLIWLCRKYRKGECFYWVYESPFPPLSPQRVAAKDAMQITELASSYGAVVSESA